MSDNFLKEVHDMITVVGLGNRPEDITDEGRSAIERADFVFVRSLKTEVGKAVGTTLSMDDLYEKCEDFDSLASAMADRLLQLDFTGRVVYCTDGDALSDSVVGELVKRHARLNIVRGVSQGVARPCGAKLTMSAVDAVGLRPYIDGAAAVEITEIADAMLAGEVKLYLLEYFAPDTKVFMTVPDYVGYTKVMHLEEIDREKNYAYDTCLMIEGSAALCKPRYGFGDLMRIMSRLTAPDGCPWDKAQTHESIRTNLIEEAYEAVDAIDSGDIDAMREEIGDVLLQAVFHCDMASRTGEFTLGDVISELCSKLYFRHTHIFGKDKASDSSEALGFWENAKATEKQYTGLYDILMRMPKGFPSLLRTQKAIKKAVKADAVKPSEPITEEELASALFELCARAAAGGVDAETALNKKLGEFIAEFKGK